MRDRVLALVHRERELLAFLCGYVALYFAWLSLGSGFYINTDLWQFLPLRPLASDLAGSLLDLHSQPPLLNLMLGVAVKCTLTTGWRAEALLAPVFFVVGAGSAFALVRVAQRALPAHPIARKTVVAVFLLNPFFYGSLTFFFYTPLEVLFLLLAVLYTFAYLRAPTWRALAAATAPALLLVYTRSLFHPSWFVAFVTALGLLRRAAWSRRHAAVVIVAVALVLAWPLKNQVRFGFFGYSSWAGYSLARQLPLAPSPAVEVFIRGPHEPLPAEGLAEVEALVPERFSDRPTLSALTKPNGAPNWNHYAVIPVFQRRGSEAMAFLREHPEALVARAIYYYLNGFSLYEGRWPYDERLAPEVHEVPRWASVYEAATVWPLHPFDPRWVTVHTGFAVVFPLLVLLPAVVVLARRRRLGDTERAVLVMLFSVVWVLAVALLVDGLESNRMRFSTEPFALLTFAWALTATAEKVRVRLRALSR